MQLIAMLASYGPWSWIVAGLVLLGVELVVPGGVFVWLGAAAIVTGLVTLAVPLDWAVQWGLFGVLSIASIALWLGVVRRRFRETSDRPYLNERASRYVGNEAELVEAIAGGNGRIALGDTVWRVTGPDLPVGSRVRVVGTDGAVLKVEAA